MVFRSSTSPSVSYVHAIGMKPLRVLRYFYLRLLRLQATPAEIARGLSMGVFVGMFPFLGFQTLVAVLLATLIRGNKIAAAAATWISNPLTYVPLYAFNFRIGQQVFGARSLHVQFTERASFENLTQMGTDFVIVMLAGCVLVGTIGAVFTYVLALPLLRSVKKRLRKHP